ncbi:MAG TPA: hypothetical protein VGO76_20625 [Luteibacter sp.]|jgi:hypothetical protein|nr:hypothetical protein [Luteibacter sp.]
MHRPHVFASPYSAGDKGFRIQAVTHLLTAVPARGMLGMVAGSAKVNLPALPDGVSAFGIRAVTNGYTVSCDNVSSLWLTENAKAFQAYIDELRKTLARGNVRLDGYARSLILEGTVEIYVAHDGDTRFDLLDDLLMEEHDYRECLDLLRSAPFDARTPLAFAPEPGDSPYDAPGFMFGTQAWLDGRRLLIEYVVEDTGKTETVAIDRQAFAERLEQAFYAMLEPSGRLRAAFPALAGHPA